MLRAAFFDLDDTLCETTKTAPLRLYAALETIAEREPHRSLVDLIDTLYGLPVEERRLPQLLLALSVTDTETVVAAQAAHDAAVLAHLELAEGAQEALEDLSRHLLLGLISNGESLYQRKKLEVLGLTSYFPAPVISQEVGYTKPDPQIFLLALRQAGIQPEEAVFVGNTWDLDVAAAAQVGMRAVWLSKDAKEAPGDEVAFVIPSMKQLPAMLRIQGLLPF